MENNYLRRWEILNYERRIASLEERIKFLQGALLTLLEDGEVLKNNKDFEVEVSALDFAEIYELSMTDYFELEGQEADKKSNKSINANMSLHWQGLKCNLGSGAIIYNNIVSNLEEIYEDLFV